MKKGNDDIVSSERRSIRDIPLPKRTAAQAEEKKQPVYTEAPISITKETTPPPARPVATRRTSNNAPKTRSGGVWLVAIVAILAVAFSATWLLSKTTVNVNAKKITLASDGVYPAASSAAEGSVFSFDTIELTTDLSKTVDANGTKEASTKAEGTVTIFNNFSTTAQALVTGTRLEDPNGLIFKINSAVTVPGRKTVSGKIVPGSIDVKVTAESAGAKYNIAVSDFTVPGFKGTEKFNAFYARSKAAMTSGASGTVAVVDAEALKTAREELQKELLPAAIAKVKAELPQDFIFLEGAYKTSFKSYEPAVQSGNKAEIKEEVTIKGYVFKQPEFIKALAKEANLELIENAPITLDHTSVKVLSIEENAPKAFFKLEGTLRGEYTLDEPELKKALRGQKKKDVPKILTAFPIIEKAQVIVSPFWVGSLPSSEKKIHIVKES